MNIDQFLDSCSSIRKFLFPTDVEKLQSMLVNLQPFIISLEQKLKQCDMDKWSIEKGIKQKMKLKSNYEVDIGRLRTSMMKLKQIQNQLNMINKVKDSIESKISMIGSLNAMDNVTKLMMNSSFSQSEALETSILFNETLKLDSRLMSQMQKIMSDATNIDEFEEHIYDDDKDDLIDQGVASKIEQFKDEIKEKNDQPQILLM